MSKAKSSNNRNSAQNRKKPNRRNSNNDFGKNILPDETVSKEFDDGKEPMSLAEQIAESTKGKDESGDRYQKGQTGRNPHRRITTHEHVGTDRRGSGGIMFKKSLE